MTKKTLLSKTELFNTLSEKEKVLFLLYDYPNSKREEVGKLMLGC